MDEGVPPPKEKPKKGEEATDKPWTHMSPVLAGLEETIKEWFASGEIKKTAVETTTHVEAAKIQKAPRKRPSKKKAGASAGEGDTATAVAEAPVQESAPEQLEEAPDI